MYGHSINIDKKLQVVYPEIRIGCLWFHAEVKAPDAEFWKYMDETVVPEVVKSIEGKEWSQIPGIRGSRAAYKAFGRKPGRYRVSSESLIRRVRRGDELYHINSVVDVNNLISVKSGLSVCSYDLDTIKGDIVLRKANAGEGYQGIGREYLDLENMLVFCDDEGLFGCSMSDSERTMVTDGSRDFLVTVFCFEDAIDMEALMQESADAFARYAGAEDISVEILDARI